MEQIHFNFPFQKVNKQKRIVTGIATAENIDQSGDIVDFNGSLEAFRNWVGNIREMHGKEAVGKAVSFNPVMVDYQGQRYAGIEVSAYVSKGAPNTWEKVLDGTLRGFSIGGGIVDKEVVNIDGQEHRKIKKYILSELSLVDNPDNPAALISMVKMAADGHLEIEFEDLSDLPELVEKDHYTIYYCDEHKIIKAGSNECDSCDNEMVDIGFTEEFDVEIIDKLIEKYEINKVKTDQISEDILHECMECGDVYEDSCETCVDIEADDDIEKAEGFVPPESVRQAAARGLELRDEFHRGGTMVGVARARDLSNGKAVSLSTIRRMVSYFARHEVDKQGQGWSPDEEGYPSAGKIAWLLWGGDPGRTWANKISAQQDSKEGNMEKNTDLQNNEVTDSVTTMELSAEQKVSMIHKFISWLGFSDDEVTEEVEKAASEVTAVVDEVVTDEVAEDVVEEVVEKDGGSEVDINELTAAISGMLDEKLTKNREELEATIDAKIEEKLEAVNKAVADVTEKVDEVSTSVTEVTEKVETIDETTAVKKSVDKTDEKTETVEKAATESFWGNIFVPQGIVEVLGYES